MLAVWSWGAIVALGVVVVLMIVLFFVILARARRASS
jgi:hypothetical protein